MAKNVTPIPIQRNKAISGGILSKNHLKTNSTPGNTLYKTL